MLIIVNGGNYVKNIYLNKNIIKRKKTWNYKQIVKRQNQQIWIIIPYLTRLKLIVCNVYVNFNNILCFPAQIELIYAALYEVNCGLMKITVFDVKLRIIKMLCKRNPNIQCVLSYRYLIENYQTVSFRGWVPVQRNVSKVLRHAIKSCLFILKSYCFKLQI